MNDEEFERLAKKIDWGNSEDCDSPYSQDFLDEMNGIEKKDVRGKK